MWKGRLSKGQGKKISDLPEGMPGKGEKKGEGERGLGRALPFPHYAPRKVGKKSGRSPAPLRICSAREGLEKESCVAELLAGVELGE